MLAADVMANDWQDAGGARKLSTQLQSGKEVSPHVPSLASDLEPLRFKWEPQLWIRLSAHGGHAHHHSNLEPEI